VHDGYFFFRANAVAYQAHLVSVEATRQGQVIASGPPTMLYGLSNATLPRTLPGETMLEPVCRATVRLAATPVLGSAAAADLVDEPLFTGDTARPVVLYGTRTALAACVIGSTTGLPLVRMCCLLHRSPALRPLDVAGDLSGGLAVVLGAAVPGADHLRAYAGSRDLGPPVGLIDARFFAFVRPWGGPAGPPVDASAPITVAAVDARGKVLASARAVTTYAGP